MLLKSYPTIITHSVSAGALLCDATEANAFIAPTGIDFTPYRGKQIEIWSGSTLWARAWVSETAPTGDGAGAELLDSELVENGSFATDTIWQKMTGWSINTGTGQAEANTSGSDRGNSIYELNKLVSPNGKLYKTVFDIKSISAGSFQSYLAGVVTGTPFASVADNNTSYLSVITAGNNHIYIRTTATVATVGAVDNYSVKNVLDPAPTGALLLSSNGGSRGYAYKHASFDPNAAVTLRVLATRVFSGNGSYIR